MRALVKLYEDNAATLTPDPLYSAFYDSHPPAAVRIARLQTSLTPFPERRRHAPQAPFASPPSPCSPSSFAALAQKQPAPFAAGDPKAGKTIVERDCVACHAASSPATPTRCTRGPTTA